MATDTTTGRIKQSGPSPYIKNKAENPPQGVHLDWIRTVSDAFTGSNGTGDITAVYNATQNTIGKWKAIGGIVYIGIICPTAGTWKITLPGTALYKGPMFFSDGQVVWPDTSNKITITTATTSVCGWQTYWG